MLHKARHDDWEPATANADVGVSALREPASRCGWPGDATPRCPQNNCPSAELGIAASGLCRVGPLSVLGSEARSVMRTEPPMK